MTKEEFISSVATAAEIDRKTAQAAIDAYHEVVTRTLQGGEDVKLSGFGIFSRLDVAARDARNPRTGEPVRIPAQSRAKFKASIALNRVLKA